MYSEQNSHFLTINVDRGRRRSLTSFVDGNNGIGLAKFNYFMDFKIN